MGELNLLVKYTSKELDLMARLMRAEALSEGNLGMLMVGNVIINRCIARCDIFENLSSMYEIIYQNPGGFSGVNSSLFQGKSTKFERELAKRCINGEYFHPATNALWFYASKSENCKKKFFSQPLCGKYKSHCFYKPSENDCI